MSGPIRLRAAFVQPLPAPELDILWDPEAGTLTGALASDVEQEARAMRSHGGTVSLHTGEYSEADPMHDTGALAIVILSLGYTLPEPLAVAFAPLSAAAAEASKGDPEGVVY